MGSILDVKSSICFPAQCPQGAFGGVIIALVYSVNVCQMDATDTTAAAAAAGGGACARGRVLGKRKKEEAL